MSGMNVDTRILFLDGERALRGGEVAAARACVLPRGCVARLASLATLAVLAALAAAVGCKGTAETPSAPAPQTIRVAVVAG